MSSQRLPLAAAVLATLTLFAVLLDAVLALGNQRLEAEVQARQQFLVQTAQFNQVSNALIQGLASIAVNANDAAVRDLLAEFGITASANGAPASPAK